MSKVIIIDYGMGNTDSVLRAIEECGGFPYLSKEPEDIKTATHIILPGVGAFAEGMQNLKATGIIPLLEEQVFSNHIPFLGICLGMQLLATSGTEFGITSGLNWIKGEVKKIEKTEKNERIPHVGWNELIIQKDSPLLNNIPNRKDFYFVHSYHFIPQNESDILAKTPYCGGFVSAIQKDNVFGTQFHPEKSQKVGFLLMKNFLGF